MTDSSDSVDADLYVLLNISSEALWTKLDSRVHEEFRSSFALRERDVVLQREQPLPTTMAGWRYLQLELDADEVAHRAGARTISEAALVHIPDTLGWNPLRLVSDRLRALLANTFPEGSQFFPFFAVDPASGTSKPTDFWYWLPRHYLSFKANPGWRKEDTMVPCVWGALGKQDVTWEMYHNTAFQEFVAAIPFWTPSPTFGEVVFRPDVYRSIKAAGFTGFEEAAAANHLRQTPEQSVGYVHYRQ